MLTVSLDKMDGSQGRLVLTNTMIMVTINDADGETKLIATNGGVIIIMVFLKMLLSPWLLLPCQLPRVVWLMCVLIWSVHLVEQVYPSLLCLLGVEVCKLYCCLCVIALIT